MIKCDYDCENCNRYTTVHYKGAEGRCRKKL